jgi:hypothetical protein
VLRISSVTTQRQPPRAPGLPRALGLLVLLVGVALMHTAVFAGGHAMRMPETSDDHRTGMPAGTGVIIRSAAAAAMASGSIMPQAGDHRLVMNHPGVERLSGPDEAASAIAAAPIGLRSPHHQAAAPTGGQALTGSDDRCGGMHAMHPCVFVLTMLLLALGLAVLGWVGIERNEWRPGRTWPVRCARPPPWTVLSLAELAILRI